MRDETATILLFGIFLAKLMLCAKSEVGNLPNHSISVFSIAEKGL